MNRKILHIALPSIISTLTVPMLGLVDLGLSGHLNSSTEMGAIAVGAMIFNLVYWLFGFLRMSTGSLTAQAYGSHDAAMTFEVGARSVAIALLCSLFIILFQRPVEWLSLWLIGPSAEVGAVVQTYFRILVYGAPAVLLSFCFAGWFLGMQNARVPMWVSIIQNIVNMCISTFFVVRCQWGVVGIAWGTFIAQYVALIMYVAAWMVRYTHLRKYWINIKVFSRQKLREFARMNSDLFLRTLCMISVQLFFTSFGARQGNDILAANAVLLQLFILFSYFLDGFAYAGEALGGYFVGANERDSYTLLKTMLFRWGWGIVAMATFCFAIGGSWVIGLLTDKSEVASLANYYLPYVCLVPVCGFAAFLYDGLFLGATATRYMLVTLIWAVAGFFGIILCLSAVAGNHALWVAFLAFLLIRSLCQMAYYRKILSRFT